MLAEFSWNHSRLLNFVLVRGAATIQDKEWGTTITWRGSSKPLMESGDELDYDMIFGVSQCSKIHRHLQLPETGFAIWALKQRTFDASERF